MKKANLPIDPVIIVVLALAFGVLAYMFIMGVLPAGQEEALSFFDMFL